MSERRNFKKWVVDVVYENQSGLCIKCGRSLEAGLHKHHIDGDASNNSVENLQLLCPQCHRSEQWVTLQKQREKHLTQLDNLIDSAIAGEVNGAVIDKLVEAIKLSLSIENKLYGDVELPPISVRLQSNMLIQEMLLKEYKRGFEEGIKTAYNTMIVGMMNSVPQNVDLDKMLNILGEKRE
ncbi:MAG: HNH endonuclease [Caldisericum exile]|uniref:HNH endonuclease n=1 Tax=Caldisericum exile TaxID=693075 RepID=UPI003C70883D